MNKVESAEIGEVPDFSQDYRSSNWFSKIIHGWANRFIVYAKKNKKVEDNVIMIAMPEKLETHNLTSNIENTFESMKKSNPKVKYGTHMKFLLLKAFKYDVIS